MIAPLPEKTAPTDNGREKIRRLIITLIFIIYYLLIFEGALRKWFLPFAQKLIFFIRDPFVLSVYILAFKYKMWPKPSPIFIAGIASAVLFAALALIQSVILGVHPVISAIGWRGYFWYIPLAFIIGEQFRGKDVAALCRHTMWIAIPIACLSYLQFRSGEYGFLNRVFDEEVSHMTLSMGFCRVAGTFTIAAAQAVFIGSLVAINLAIWLLPARARPISRLVLWASTGAVLVNLYVCGSRSAFFEAMIILVFALFSGFLIRDYKQKLRCFLWPGLIAIVGLVLYVTVFSQAFEVMQQRFTGADANGGSTLARGYTIVTGVFESLSRANFIGYGMGMGSNAGAFLAAGTRRFFLSENELPRIVEESGVPGLIYIIYRLWLVAWIFAGAVVATRRANNPLPIVLFGFEGVLLATGQLTLQSTFNGFGWLFAGFCIAANQLGLERAVVLPYRPRAKPMSRVNKRISGSG